MKNGVQSHVDPTDDVYYRCRQLKDGDPPYCEVHLGWDLTMFMGSPEQLDELAEVAKEAAAALREAQAHYKTVCEEIDASIDAEAIEEARRAV